MEKNKYKLRNELTSIIGRALFNNSDEPLSNEWIKAYNIPEHSDPSTLVLNLFKNRVDSVVSEIMIALDK